MGLIEKENLKKPMTLENSLYSFCEGSTDDGTEKEEENKKTPKKKKLASEDDDDEEEEELLVGWQQRQ